MSRHLTAAVCIAALTAGCGGAPDEVRPELQPVEGRLTINGKPATGAMLVLHPADKKDFDARGTRPTAQVGGDGVFHVMTYQTADGAPAGEYNVGVLWFDKPQSSNPHDQLGGRFANPATSGLKIRIQKDQPALEPLAIENARIGSRPPVRRDKDGLEI